MTTIKVKRLIDDGDTTLGFMQVDDFDFSCGTLEDEAREVKVGGETRIPAGRYEIKVRADSPMANKYRTRFGSWHQGMLWLQDVPGFTYVYIHAGNTDEHTDGCILVGDQTDWSAFTIGQSGPCYATLAHKCFAQLAQGQLFIEIEDEL